MESKADARGAGGRVKGPGRLAERGISLDKLVILGAFLALYVLFSLTARNFFTVRNALTLALQTSTITIMAIGVTFTIITGGIDLAIGSVVALAGTVAVMCANAGLPIWLSMAAGLLSGVFCGLCSGLLITGLKLPPFIATLGMQMVARGAVLTATNAMSKPAPEAFGALGNKTVLNLGREFPGIAYPVIIMAFCAFAFGFVLKRTRIGRYAYAIGSNEESSRLSGIKVDRYKIVAYMISGFCAAVTGVILASRMVTSQPNGGNNYELNAIASSVIGGTSLMGGVGTVGGAVIGSFIIGVLSVGLTMQGASYFVQQIAIGLVVIGAVAVDQLRYKKK